MTALLRTSLHDIQSIYNGLLEAIIKSTEDQALLIAHFGDFSQVKMEHLLRIVESSVLEQGDKRQTMKRVYGVMIELLQNISLHGALDREKHMHAFITLSRSEKGYHIHTGNLVFESESTGLRTRMDELIAMDKNQLRKAYIDTLCNDDFTSKGGAGLGLLTIAKRSSEVLDYSIDNLETPFAYFRLSLSLDLDQA